MTATKTVYKASIDLYNLNRCKYLILYLSDLNLSLSGLKMRYNLYWGRSNKSRYIPDPNKIIPVLSLRLLIRLLNSLSYPSLRLLSIRFNPIKRYIYKIS